MIKKTGPKAKKSPKMTAETARKFIDEAQAKFYSDEGSIEVDEPANDAAALDMISEASDWRKNGVYVKAWVWIYTEDIK